MTCSASFRNLSTRTGDTIDDNENPVIIAGFGFGQIVDVCSLPMASKPRPGSSVTLTCCGALASRCYGDVGLLRASEQLLVVDDREKALLTWFKHFPT